jgi:hypothetical protein
MVVMMKGVSGAGSSQTTTQIRLGSSYWADHPDLNHNRVAVL